MWCGHQDTSCHQIRNQRIYPLLTLLIITSKGVKFMTLDDLGYELYDKNSHSVSYVKYLGDNEITLEISLDTGEVLKYGNDFRKIVPVEPDGLEVILMENLLND